MADCFDLRPAQHGATVGIDETVFANHFDEPLHVWFATAVAHSRPGTPFYFHIESTAVITGSRGLPWPGQTNRLRAALIDLPHFYKTFTALPHQSHLLRTRAHSPFSAGLQYRGNLVQLVHGKYEHLGATIMLVVDHRWHLGNLRAHSRLRIALDRGAPVSLALRGGPAPKDCRATMPLSQPARPAGSSTVMKSWGGRSFLRSGLFSFWNCFGRITEFIQALVEKEQFALVAEIYNVAIALRRTHQILCC